MKPPRRPSGTFQKANAHIQKTVNELRCEAISPDGHRCIRYKYHTDVDEMPDAHLDTHGNEWID